MTTKKLYTLILIISTKPQRRPSLYSFVGAHISQNCRIRWVRSTLNHVGLNVCILFHTYDSMTYDVSLSLLLQFAFGTYSYSRTSNIRIQIFSMWEKMCANVHCIRDIVQYVFSLKRAATERHIYLMCSLLNRFCWCGTCTMYSRFLNL